MTLSLHYEQFNFYLIWSDCVSNFFRSFETRLQTNCALEASGTYSGLEDEATY